LIKKYLIISIKKNFDKEKKCIDGNMKKKSIKD